MIGGSGKGVARLPFVIKDPISVIKDPISEIQTGSNPLNHNLRKVVRHTTIDREKQTQSAIGQAECIEDYLLNRWEKAKAIELI